MGHPRGCNDPTAAGLLADIVFRPRKSPQVPPSASSIADQVLTETERPSGPQATAETTRELALAAERSGATTGSEDGAVALSELSPLDQEIITMLSWDGLAPREVASILRLSPNAVRIRAHRARARLRVLLATRDAEDEVETPDAATPIAHSEGRGW